MAKLPALPTALDLVKAGTTGKGLPYGKHENITVSVFDRAAYIYDGVKPLASVRLQPDGSGLAVLRGPKDVTTQSVPYVNAFVEGTGQFVIKDWRSPKESPEYGLRAVKGTTVTKSPTVVAATTKVVTANRRAKPVKVAPVSPEETLTTITVSNAPTAAATSSLRGIPGIKFLPKARVKGAGRGFTQVGTTIIPTESYKTLLDAWKLRQNGEIANVLITGPAGTAKTMLVEDFAASLGMPYLKVDGGAIRTADDWAGAFRQDPQTKVWAHRWSPFAQALRTGEPMIIHVDELTRTESPQALNALLGLFDATGTLLVPDANSVLEMPKGILVIATANIGPEFVGTLPIDGAVRQRFPDGIRMEYPPAKIEADLLVSRHGIDLGIAQGLVRMAASQRKDRDNAQMYPSGGIISTRILLYIASRIAIGNRTPREVIKSVLSGQFEVGDDAALSVCVDAQFPKNGTLPSATPEADDTVIIADRHYFVSITGNDDCEYAFPSGELCTRPRNHGIHIDR
jgi:MoxR-like ATPase